LSAIAGFVFPFFVFGLPDCRAVPVRGEARSAPRKDALGLKAYSIATHFRFSKILRSGLSGLASELLLYAADKGGFTRQRSKMQALFV
jgi:hypothetical protein